MDEQKFLNLVEMCVQKQAIDDLIRTFTIPPGRRPREVLTKISEWYGRLNVDEQKLFYETVTESVRTALFGLFAIVDGVRVVDKNVDKFIIAAQDFQGKRTLINDDTNSDLHSHFAPN
jgi:hypothetical protein